MNIIELENVSYQYKNEFMAIEQVSCSIEKGEKVAIIGENGAGKTTLAKLMNGLIKPLSGKVIIDGKSTRGKTAAQMSQIVGYVFQNPDDQIFNNDVISEIEYGPKKLNVDPKKMNETIKAIVKLLEIEEYLTENPYNLPFSIRKLVSIASILSMDVDVLVLDEPTAGQDYKGLKILSHLIEFLQNKNKTVITITHDMEFVVENFDRIIVMAHKHIITDASKRSVFWNEEILSQANIKQPYISDLAKELKLGGNVLTISELISGFKKIV